jgi:hypothetical protein
MTGILLIGVALTWLAIVALTSVLIAKRIARVPMRIAVGVPAFIALLILPVADELVGSRQFEALCQRYATQYIDKENARNRSVLYVPRGADQYAEGTAVRIRIDPIVYRDTETGRVLVSYNTVHAEGGWLIRSLGVSESGGPLLFNQGCAPKDQDAFKREFNIRVAN